MPYPPESSWNDPPTAAQIASMNKALRILKRPEVTEANRPETRWQARDAMKELWDEVNDGPRVKAALIKNELENNPGTRSGGEMSKNAISTEGYICANETVKQLLIDAINSQEDVLKDELRATEKRGASRDHLLSLSIEKQRAMKKQGSPEADWLNFSSDLSALTIIKDEIKAWPNCKVKEE